MFSLDLSDLVRFSVHGAAGSGGVAGHVDGWLSSLEHLISLSPGLLFAELMPGIAALPNLHPLLVHFPIALLTAFFLLDAAACLLRKPAWRDGASWFLYSGTVFAGLTVVAGMQAAATVPHGDDVHLIMEQHEHLGLAVLTVALVLSSWRLLARRVVEQLFNGLYLLLAAMLVVLLASTADLGGLMVYGHGVGVAPVLRLNAEAVTAHHHDHGGEAIPGATEPVPAAPAAPGAAVAPAGPEVHTHADGSQHVHKHGH